MGGGEGGGVINHCNYDNAYRSDGLFLLIDLASPTMVGRDEARYAGVSQTSGTVGEGTGILYTG